MGYHPTATPPPLTHNRPPNNQFFHNLFENNQPRTSTMIQTPYAGASPTTPADLVEGITQIVNQATKSNKRDETAKQMMKNIKIFSMVATKQNASTGSAKLKQQLSSLIHPFAN